MKPSFLHTLPARQAGQIRRLTHGLASEIKEGWEVKEASWTPPGFMGMDNVYLFLVVGMVGDEGTMAETLCREVRHICFSKGGGVKLLNAKNKKESRGYWNALKGETKP